MAATAVNRPDEPAAQSLWPKHFCLQSRRNHSALSEAMHSDIIQTVTSSEESIVLFEMSDPRGKTVATSRHPQELAAKSAQALVQAMGTIQALANRTSETLAKLPQPPATCEVEFGIKMDAQAGALVSNSPEASNLRIKFVWSPQSSAPAAE
ncbi:CU044_2847 family protein [Halomicronema sp. CCY15110]|uniref:CU044_2847 family protein n=1 Tax=Halomicronema sp. CCY15110 TaxID=2767773 RepID=UPI00194FDA1F|nr:CU044_2847 family protein [Halomicronema sp. CCY15110]